MQPFVLMVAGPNGAGKTTLTQWMRARGIDFAAYINPDDIARELEGSYKSRVAAAQEIADRRRDECIAAKRSFSFETVMSHPSKIDVLRRAKAAGYLVHLYFVGTEDPTTNIDRVAIRVAEGGHDVPRDRIVARWQRSMGLLREAIDASDTAFVFDNSATMGLDGGPRLVLWKWKSDDMKVAGLAGGPHVPIWVARYILERGKQIDLDRRIAAATDAILAEQQPDGHWVYELEADATIPAEYVLMVHYFAETPDLVLERKIGVYLRRIQGAHGGWPLFHDGAFDMSASVKAYFALKMIGDDIDADHMRRARDAILSRGGAVKSNVFTRALLSLYGVVRWHSVPVMPVEIMLLPKWFPFHIDKISYWARTVIVPLLVLQALEAEGDQSARRHHRRAVPRGSAHGRRAAQGAAPEMELVPRLPRNRHRAARARAGHAERPAQARDRPVRRLGDRAAQRHRRARRDLPGDGECREDVRGAGVSAGSSGPQDRARLARQAARRQGGRGLLPALRLAGVGHLAGRARAARSRRREGDGGGEPRARLAQAACRSST